MTPFRENVLGSVFGKAACRGAIHSSLLPAVPVPGSFSGMTDSRDKKGSDLIEVGMNHTLFTDPAGFRPRMRSGAFEYPVHHMRGGTSTGLVLWGGFVPEDVTLREELLRHLMGVPFFGTRPGNRQITGLGRGPATSNKVFLADTEDTAGRTRLVSTLAQLASDHSGIDWSVNCGNMSASLLLWAFDSGLIKGDSVGPCDVDIRNTNTGVITTARMTRNANGGFMSAEIPGVDGAFPSVDLFLHDPVGAKTGKLLPTGNPADDIAGYRVSCVDVAVPMVIVEATSLGKTAHEPIAELETDGTFMASLRTIWVAAGLRMGLAHRDGLPMTAVELERSETIPKICIIGKPRAGGHVAVRYFTPQTAHASMAVSGGCCLAAAALIPGTVAHGVAQGVPALASTYADFEVGIENPAGILEATIVARMGELGPQISSAAYRRSTQILLRGYVPLYRASDALMNALSQ
jgi:2-methylaconitate cis-trans-isomerase PrpF